MKKGPVASWAEDARGGIYALAIAARSTPVLSVVVPLHDEETLVPTLYERPAAALDGLGEAWELILVDDGSRDRTYSLAIELHERDARVRVLRLSRNFGHQLALSAGLDVARGEAVITMDGDLQHPPEVIPELVARWRDGHDVVYAVMSERQGEPLLKGVTARLFYRLLSWLVDIDVPAAAGDFRLVDRTALGAFRSMRESNRYLRGMFSWIGFAQTGVPYVSPPRPAGKSKYTRRRMVRLAMNAIIGFSERPLRLALAVGFVVSLASLLYGLASVVVKITGGHAVPGWASIMVLVGIVGGTQLLVLGVIGEYIARIYDEVKRRPLYLIRGAHGFSEEEEPHWR
jgi:glycosyltransferase involved in cell wall biosynthesis